MRLFFLIGYKTIRKLERTLRESGIQPTAQRVEIASVLLAEHQHLSADDVLARLNEMKISVSKATVYNTLSLFMERGLVRAISIDGSRTFYDSNVEEHSHFYNPESGELIDVSLDKPLNLDLLQVPDGTSIDNIELVIWLKNNV